MDDLPGIIRRALIHNIRILCPILSNYVTNCYNIPARLFVIGGIELRSKEGTTQGDPIGMAMYAIGITPLLELMLTVITGQDQMVAFADDLTAVGKCESLILWWENLKKNGPLFGYFPQPQKSWLIVKEQYVEKANELFRNTNIQITTRG